MTDPDAPADPTGRIGPHPLMLWIAKEDLSLRAFAVKCGIHYQTLSNVINRRHTPQGKTCIAIVDGTEGEVTMKDLIPMADRPVGGQRKAYYLGQALLAAENLQDHLADTREAEAAWKLFRKRRAMCP